MSHSTTRSRARTGRSLGRKSDAQSRTDSKAKKTRREQAEDFDRLEQVVTALVEAHQHTLLRNDELRAELDEKSQRLRQLESKLLDANQRRQDVSKRIEELIAQVDQLDAQLDEPEDSEEYAAGSTKALA